MVTPRNFILIKPKSTLYSTKGKEWTAFCIEMNQETRDKKWDYFIAYQRGNINDTTKPDWQGFEEVKTHGVVEQYKNFQILVHDGINSKTEP